MGFGYELTAIAKAFIAIAILVGLIEGLTSVTETLAEKCPGIPNQYHWTVSYSFSCFLGSIICWQGHFDLFVLLDFNWWNLHWLGWLLTGCIIGGGAKRLLYYFKLIKAVPGSVIGGSSFDDPGGDLDPIPTEPPTPESNQKGEE